ncbi:MAG: RNB domain-containing ribonuclease [Spongiibacteraceae bacterium]|jgi:VacB/RNase II family 3'-5' exoribonuclease|nr:RNB domain-containing ribonuclease [Spongiibacteraceae bacterium]
MLDTSALQQLRQLKQNIQSRTARHAATVKGTQGRYGFAQLDDGREVFLPPEEMQKVFAGDRVGIVFDETADKPQATVEKLLDSPLGVFAGRYRVRGNGHFVEPDIPRFNRLLFLPPNARAGAVDGDYVQARVTRHPIRSGKPQAEVIWRIGNDEQPFLEQDYAGARFDLPGAWPDTLPEGWCEPDLADYAPCTLPFVTIDAPATQDMDDALHVTADEQGWTLHVAIADPTAFVMPGSALEQLIGQRGTSVYLPGRTLDMLPPVLANQRSSLQAGELRPALLCALTVDRAGTVIDSRWQLATVTVAARLSYAEASVAADDSSHPQHRLLAALAAVSAALHGRRRAEHLVMPERAEFELQIDATGHLAGIAPLTRTPAHRVVEECMVAANRAAAEHLATQDALFVAHAGFRPERLADIAKLLDSALPGASGLDLSSLEGYLALLQAVDAYEGDLPLRAILVRSLERSRQQRRAAPHFGMGLCAYTTVTSPIRKYSDFFLHRALKAQLRGQPPVVADDAVLDRLAQTQERARRASHAVEQRMKRRYLFQRHAEGERQWQGEISHINSNGFGVRLDDTGIEGFVDLRKVEENFSFDSVFLTLTSKTRWFQLGQQVVVGLASDAAEQAGIGLALADKE